jgi:hypothetical protein
VLFSGVLPSHSPRIADISIVVVIMSALEVVAFSIALRRLWVCSADRTRGNIALIAFGAISLVPAVLFVVIELYVGAHV